MNRLRSVYLIVANVAILILIAQLGAHVAIRTFQAITPAFDFEELSEPARRNYAHMTRDEVVELWTAMRQLRFGYRPSVGFFEEAITSRFVRVDAHGIRANGGPARDVAGVAGAVWMLGGSTTFGYGVADGDTIPAQLETALGRPVINLGVRGHAAGSENRLLRHYLRAGVRPSLVIFLDGINESCRVDGSDELGALMRSAQRGYTWQFGEPVLFAAWAAYDKLQRPAGTRPRSEPLELTCEHAGQRNSLATLETRILLERDATCALYDVSCLTFIQPFAGVHGRHDAADPEERAYMRGLFEHLEPAWRNHGAIFVTSALDRVDRHAFVDSWHYGAEAGGAIARAIAVSVAETAESTRTPDRSAGR